MYMNDITCIFKKADVVLFADDTDILFTGNDSNPIERTVVNEQRYISD